MYQHQSFSEGDLCGSQCTKTLSGIRIFEDLPYPATVSHHPPISVFYYISPTNKVAAVGELRPKSHFLGNSVSMFMEGENRIYPLGCPEDNGTS